MKKTFRAVLAAATSGGSKDEDGEEATDYLEEALSLLRDHREASYLTPPSALPVHIVDPSDFPYFQPVSGWATLQDGEPPYVREIQLETVRSATFIRDDWIRKQMKSLEGSFTTRHEFKVWAGTYNLAGKKPEFPVDPFVCAGERKRNEKFCYDIVVVGFQEMVDLNVQNAMSDSATRDRSAQWLTLLERALEDSAKRNNESEGYVLLAQKSLVGLLINVFILKKHRPNVSGVQSCSVATGVMGVVGNKGGCCVRFDLCDTSFCFVCAHLAAHADAVDARNTDVRTINAKASFKLDPPVKSLVPEKHHSRIAATTPGALARGELMIREHDYVVWLGDFNYRMDASHSPETVFDKVSERDLYWLRQNDQLLTEMRAGRVFKGFEEVAPISFLPTYKFEPGTDTYERRPEKKLRAPAWTDRIVWRIPPSEAGRATCLVYDRVEYMRASDHKPVEAALGCPVRIINDELRNEAYKQVRRKLDGLSINAGASGVALDISPRELDFGPVVYRQQCPPMTLELRNPTHTPLCWRLASRPGQDDLCASWLSVEPTFGLLLPNETVQLKVDCLVNLDVARSAMSGEGPLVLRDTLEVRIHPSLEQPFSTLSFGLVKVKCLLKPTCFGAQINSLLWALRPVRQFGTGDEQYAQIQQSQAQSSAVQPQSVPKELWRIVNRLKNTLGEHRIFLHHAESQDECARVRDCLDEGAPFPNDVSVYAFASVLLEFLDALAEPVIPSDMFPDSDSLADPLWAQNFFSQLPTPNANVLAIVIALLQRALVLSNQNKLTMQALAPVFAEVLFRPSLAAEANKESSTANASGLGEFANWLTASVPFSSASKNESRVASNLACQAFVLLMNSR